MSEPPPRDPDTETETDRTPVPVRERVDGYFRNGVWVPRGTQLDPQPATWRERLESLEPLTPRGRLRVRLGAARHPHPVAEVPVDTLAHRHGSPVGLGLVVRLARRGLAHESEYGGSVGLCPGKRRGMFRTIGTTRCKLTSATSISRMDRVDPF